MVNASRFVKENICLCVCTLGLAILGYLGYRAVYWIINKCQKTEIIDQVARQRLIVPLEENYHKFNNSISSHNPLSHLSNPNPSSDNVRVEEVPVQQVSKTQKKIAAIQIQSVYRGHIARLALKKLQASKLEQHKSKAVVKIQSIWRGYSARVKVEKVRKPLLNYALLESAKPYIDTPSNLKDIPRASSGKTRVYFPKELPIVLKQSGSPENQKRFEQMKQGHDICERSGYAHLIIPKARVYGNFIVESRLPITMHGTKKQIGLYIENRKRFTSAVKEFTGLLCQSTFCDIIGGSKDPYGTLSKTPVGRYDNIALYLEEDQGRIGLIDLEHFSPAYNKWQKERCFVNCCDAVHLFPYHLDEIMSAAQQFDSNIEVYRKDLEQMRDEVLKLFKIAYEDHLDFVREKAITLERPTAFEKLGLVRVEQLKKAIEVELRKENDEVWFKRCLGEKPDETLISFNERAFPKILDAVYKLISDILECNLESNESPPSSNAQLLALRTLEFSDQSVVYDDFINATSTSIDMLSFKSKFKIRGFLDLLLNAILKELEKGKEIAYYNSSFGYDGYATKCVFC